VKQNISGDQFEHENEKNIVALEFLIEPVFKNKKRIRASQRSPPILYVLTKNGNLGQINFVF
jgi:hypothetical protein